MKKVKAVFILDGVADQPEEAVLVGGDKILAETSRDYSLHEASYVKNGVYYVDLNDESKPDLLADNPRLLLDIIVQYSSVEFEWFSK